MKLDRVLEQRIAVFGESGSGKTVLLSSFFGAAQESAFVRESLFRVVADNVGQGNFLHQNYLGMKNSARPPEPNQFSATSYQFSVKLKDNGAAGAAKRKPFDVLRLVWHDYPGEWFEQDVSGPEENRRRIDAFRSLLGSDVALVLVDGQKLRDYAGAERQYLKSLLTNFRNGLLSLKDDLLVDGEPLVEFPRIWMLALSKADLHPDLDVFSFRDLLIENASGDIEELRAVLAELVQGSEALSVGEDFVLLSSARFDAGTIEVEDRVGLDLILPIASILPLERHLRWRQSLRVPAKVAQGLLEGVLPLATAMAGKTKFTGRFGAIAGFAGPALNEAAKLFRGKLEHFNSNAVTQEDNLAGALNGFRLDLECGEEQQVLLRSHR